MTRRTLGILFLLSIAFLALPLAAQVNDTYVVPVVGNALGAGGTVWATQFHVFNPQSQKLTITVVFLPTGGGQGDTVDFDIFPNETLYSDNIVKDLFSVAGTGSLLVATLPEKNPGVPDNVVSRSFLVTTKTFNNASSGTFGQSVPGIWTGLMDYQTDGISSVAQGIQNIGTVGVNGFRTNVGAVNLGRYSVTMYMNVYNSNGDLVASQIPFVLPPQGHMQDHLPVAVDHGSVEFFVDDASKDAVVFPYVSIVDNKSGDGVYVSPVLLATPSAIYKAGVKAASFDPTSIGKKITVDLVRQLAASAEKIGPVVRIHDGAGATRIARQ